MHLVPEMTYRETIEGPWGPTAGSPHGARLCWSVPEATLTGPRINAHLAAPGMDWIRLADNGTRRPDQRLLFDTDDGATIMLSYDQALIRENAAFLQALANGTETEFGDQYMRMVAGFDTGDERYGWMMTNLFLAEGRIAGPRRIEYRIHRVD